MNLHIYAGPILEIKPDGPLSTTRDMSDFAYEILKEALWVPDCEGAPLYFLPNLNDLCQRSNTWSRYDDPKCFVNPDIEGDKLWFADKIKDLTDMFPPDTEYEIVWGVISYWM